MKTALTVLALSCLLGVATVQDPPQSKPQPNPKAPVTVILLRHAEAGDRAHTNDPELSDAGTRRAKALARLLGNCGATHVICSKKKRTRRTVEPLAKALGLKVKEMPSTRYKELVSHLKGMPAGSVVVLAGHSNTLPPLIRGLGAKAGSLDRRGFLGKNEFDRVFVITLPVTKDGIAKTVELRYGVAGRGK